MARVGVAAALAAALAVAAAAGVDIALPDSGRCASAGARDSALLQVGVSAGRVRKLTCETCEDVFRDLGGCSAGAVEALKNRRDLDGCAALGCGDAELSARCPSAQPHRLPTCSTCADVFAEFKGCEQPDLAAAFEDMKHKAEFADCTQQRCGSEITARCAIAQSAIDDAEAHAPHRAAPTCSTCADVFAQLKGCELPDEAAAFEDMKDKPEFAGCAQQRCGSEITARCAIAQPTVDATGGSASHRPAPTCSTCADVVAAEGGCDWDDLTQALDDMAQLPAFAGCPSQDCHAQIEARCASSGAAAGTAGSQPQQSTMTCETCADVFRDLGGCGEKDLGDSSASQAVASKPEFVGCDQAKCSNEIAARCAGGQQAAEKAKASSPRSAEGDGNAVCGECVEAFSVSGGCSWVRAPAEEKGKAPLPAQCQGSAPSCGRRIVARCFEESGQFCKTAAQGDECFTHVRWAMETGIAKNATVYEGLSKDSSFEDFQMFLYLQGLADKSVQRCPPPCPSIELPCHTASAGESCHGHVLWAKTQGITMHPEWYPSRLTSESSFEEFQSWLHHIHHDGDCPMPCA